MVAVSTLVFSSSLRDEVPEWPSQSLLGRLAASERIDRHGGGSLPGNTADAVRLTSCAGMIGSMPVLGKERIGGPLQGQAFLILLFITGVTRGYCWAAPSGLVQAHDTAC